MEKILEFKLNLVATNFKNQYLLNNFFPEFNSPKLYANYYSNFSAFQGVSGKLV